MKATKVNGVYDQDPHQNPQAKRYQTLSFKDAIVQEKIEVMDTAAFAMASENNIPVMVFELFADDNLKRAIMGESIGTYIGNDVTSQFASD